MLLQVGRLCVKKYGRDAGSRAVVTEVMSDGFVKIITATRSKKERRCNPKHLEFLKEVIDVKNRDQVNRALGIIERVK